MKVVIKLALSSNFYSRDDFLVAGAILSDSLSRSGVNPNFNCASPTDCRSLAGRVNFRCLTILVIKSTEICLSGRSIS